MSEPKQLSDAVRAQILLNCWWSHDGQWFLKTARDHGLPDAMARNEDAIESMGRIEMKHLHRELGAPEVSSAELFLSMVVAAQDLVGIPAEGEMDGESAFVLRVEECMVWTMTEAAELTDVAPGCRGSLRRRLGWASVFFAPKSFRWTREFGRPDGDPRCGYRFSLGASA